MNKSNNSRSHGRRKSNRTNMQGKGDSTITLLKELVNLQDQTRNRMEPEVADIPRMKLSRNRLFTTAFSYVAPVVTANSTAPNLGAFSFSLSNAQDYQSWLSCFDAYRILQVQVEFVTYGVGVTGTTQTNGTFYSAIDYDDAAMTDPSQLIQYDTLQVVPSGQYHERRFIPRVAKALYQGAAFTGYGQEQMVWVDSNSPSVQHYGLKYAATVASSAVTVYTPIVTLFVQFKNSQ